jgi:hypothetical protein
MERLERLLPRAKQSVSNLHVTYRDRNGTLQAITGACTNHRARSGTAGCC